VPVPEKAFRHSDKLRVARDKLTRVFRYLEALNQHRNPAKRQIREQLWRLWLHGLPDHLCIKRGTSKSQSSNGKTGKTQSADEGHERFVLKVQRPVLSRPPEPPEEAAIWLKPGWDAPSEEILIHQSRNESDQAGNPRVVNFADDKRRSTALPRWKLLRDEWAKSQKPARIRGTEFLRNPDRAMKQVFEKLQLLEISAATPKNDTAKMVQPSTDLIERVIRRAEELARAWASPEPTSSEQQAS
jgi:hypothetical protein